MTEEQKARKRERAKEYYHERMNALSDEEKYVLKMKRKAYYLENRKRHIAYQTARRQGSAPETMHAELEFVAQLELTVPRLNEIAVLFKDMPRFKTSFDVLAQRITDLAEHKRKRLELIQQEL